MSGAEPAPDDLYRLLEPLAGQLGELVEGWTGGLGYHDRLPSNLRLAVLASDVLQTVLHIQRNLVERDSVFLGRNLQNLPGLAEQLTAATRAAHVEFHLPLPARHGHCLATVHLDDTEREWLALRPFAANEVPAELTCALEAGHADPHAANAQMGDGVEWWVRWTLRAFEIVQLTGCQVERANTDPTSLEKTDVCLLYTEHPGRHSFDIGT